MYKKNFQLSLKNLGREVDHLFHDYGWDSIEAPWRYILVSLFASIPVTVGCMLICCCGDDDEEEHQDMIDKRKKLIERQKFLDAKRAEYLA